MNWLDFWYEALSSQHGIIITTNNPEAARQALYRVRREAADPSLDQFSVRISPLLPEEEIWIVKDGKTS